MSPRNVGSTEDVQSILRRAFISIMNIRSSLPCDYKVWANFEAQVVPTQVVFIGAYLG